MTGPRLTDIFQHEADNALSKEISSEIWERIGRELGFSDEEIRSALPKATQGVAGPIKKRSRTFSVFFGTCAALLAVAAAVILCSPFVRNNSGSLVTIVDEAVPLADFPLSRIECLDELRYKANAVVTGERFAEDAGIHAYSADGSETEYRVVGLEDVDFTKPGKYFVQVETGSHGQEVFRIITVIIE